MRNREPMEWKRRMLLLFAIFLLCALAAPVYAMDDDEYAGYKADTLEIDVGYFGGPYYEKHVFTLDELNKMNLVTDDYTFIDNMPSVVIDHVKGVRLSDLMEAAGIDLGSVQTFYFWTKDKTSSYYTSFAKTALIDTPRYCYYSLPDNFDSETGTGNAYAVSDGRRVDTLIALGDDWNRCIAGATFGSDYENLNTDTRFRLIYGQTNAVTHTADRSAKWIHKIVVELGGAPTLTLDKSVLNMKIGSVYRAEARVNTADPVIAQNAKVTWSSSDESVATVDENGTVTVWKEGNAVITASVDGLTAALTVNGSAGSTDGSNAAGGADSGGIGTAGTAGQTQTNSDTGRAGTAKTAVEIQAESKAAAQNVSTAVQRSPEQNSVLPSHEKAGSEKGGVQNWRAYEMATDATELPEIPTDNPLLPFVGIFTAFLFLGGIMFRILKYRYDMEEKPHVFSRKSQ